MPLEERLNRMAAVRRNVARLGRMHVDVGVLGPGRNADVAFWAEYGTSRIPARGLLSRPLALHRDAYLKVLAATVDATARGADPEPRLELLGLRAVRDVRAWVTAGEATPENAPSTVRAKGSDTPLVDTGQLLSALQHRVVET